MSETAVLVLPPSLIGGTELARLIREVEALDLDLQAQKIREHAEQYHMPVMSQVLQDVLELNKLNVADDHRRQAFKNELKQLKASAPVVHMSFASSIDPKSLGRLVDWLRTSVHPQAIVNVGLQPALLGGVYIRTPNHVHDLSLRSQLKSQRHVIIDDLEALAHGK